MSSEDDGKVKINLNELKSLFSIADYAVFAGLLLVSLAIGVYYGVFKRSQMRTTEDYMLGGRQMSVFPMAMSLIASFMSAITLLGTPAEIYQYGIMYTWIVLSYFLVSAAASYLYMPVFFDLKVISVYQYLAMRFHKSAQMLGALIFCIQMCIYMAIVVYAPSLALSQVTGIDVYLSVVLIFVVCIVYTTLGGMKAVLWTDSVQVIIMFLTMIAIIIKGTVDVGGLSVVFQHAREGGRLDLSGSFDPNPGVRHTFWTLVVGGYFTWVTIYGVNQAQVQRYLCVPTKKQATTGIWINCLGLSLLMLICGYAGLVIYAHFRTCHPIQPGIVSTSDQLFPLFVMHLMGNIWGVPGLFVAGIFSGALSTVSSGINSLAAVTLEDFIIPFRKKPISPNVQANISKVLAVFFGILAFALVFVAELLGDVLQAALSIFGMVGGPLLGIFTLGMFIPWANWKGAIAGTFSALFFTFWIGIGFQVEKKAGKIHIPKLNFTTEGCESLNTTLITTTTPATSVPTDGGETLGLYYLSYMYYSMVSCLTCLIVGVAVSALTGFNNPKKMNPALIVPLGDKLFPYLSKEWRNKLNFHVGEDYREDEKIEMAEKADHN